MPGDFDRTGADQADRLDALWDELVLNGSVGLSAATDGDAPRLSLISYLHALIPNPEPAANARIAGGHFEPRRAAAALVSIAPAHLNGSHPIGPVPLPRPRSRAWWRPPLRAIELATVCVLILAIVGSVIALRPVGDGGPPAGAPGPASPSTANAPAATRLLTLQLDAPAATDALSVTIRRIILSPGARWDLPPGTFPAGATPTDQFVESGTLAVGWESQERVVRAGSNLNVEGGPEYLRAVGSEPVTFLQAVAHLDRNAPPAPPDGATVETIGTFPVANRSELHTALITLTRMTSPPGRSLDELVRGRQTSFLAVERGTLEVSTMLYGTIAEGRIGTPTSAGTELQPAREGTLTLEAGQTLSLGGGNNVYLAGSAGNEPLSALMVTEEMHPTYIPGLQGPVTVTAAECRVQARPMAELEDLIADPLAVGAPDAGLRDEAESGVPADGTTMAAIVATMRKMAACNLVGGVRIYALFSDNAIRFMASVGALSVEDVEQQLTESLNQTGNNPTEARLTVRDVVLFPDGRAGAWIDLNGEIAYITFVMVDGRWLIDAWDDREVLPGTPTP